MTELADERLSFASAPPLAGMAGAHPAVHATLDSWRGSLVATKAPDAALHRLNSLAVLSGMGWATLCAERRHQNPTAFFDPGPGFYDMLWWLWSEDPTSAIDMCASVVTELSSDPDQFDFLLETLLHAAGDHVPQGLDRAEYVSMRLRTFAEVPVRAKALRRERTGL